MITHTVISWLLTGAQQCTYEIVHYRVTKTDFLFFTVLKQLLQQFSFRLFKSTVKISRE